MNAHVHTQAAVNLEEINQQTSWPHYILEIFLIILTVPYRRAFKLYTWRPLRAIRSANGDAKVLIPLVKNWKADKFSELQSVQVAATFCAGANFSVLSYARSTSRTWVADALWFSSLMLSICAIMTTIQTKSILDDLPARDQLNASLPEYEVQRMQRAILRYKKTPGINHWIMLFVWQFPSMTMAYAWCTFLSGLTVYMCTPFIHDFSWQDRHKVAIVYLIVSFIGLVTYIFSTVFVYMGEKDFERSVANSRASTRISTYEPEAGRSLSIGRDVNKTRCQRESSDAEEINPVQNARARALLGFEHGERTRKEQESSKGAGKEQLLY